MKKLSIIVAVIVAFTAIFCFVYAMESNKEVIDNKELSSQLGFQLYQCNEQTKINQEQAILAAKETFKDVAESNDVSVQTALMTYDNYTAFSQEALDKNEQLMKNGTLKNTPVHIISFKGLKVYRSGGIFLTDEERMKYYHEEENVVVDATSGVVLFTYSYR